jgi:hypothetical protein
MKIDMYQWRVASSYLYGYVTNTATCHRKVRFLTATG